MSMKESLVKALIKLIELTVTKLPMDVVEALKKAYAQESSPIAKQIYDAIFLNIEEASKNNIPLCQDTGILMFFVKVGTRSPYIDYVYDAIIEAVREATHTIPLRPNAVDPFTNVNTGDNIGVNVPWIEVELIPRSDLLEVGLYIAGGGSSLPGRAMVFTPIEGYKSLIELVVDTISKYGVNACPPLVVGLGIGATAEIAAILSKRALLRPIGHRHPDKRVKDLEERLLQALNELNIGPQGLGGKVSVLDVHVEYSARHPATFAVGLSISCWALRRGYMKLHANRFYEITSHGLRGWI